MKMVTVKLQGVEVQAALLSPDIMKRFEEKKKMWQDLWLSVDSVRLSLTM